MSDSNHQNLEDKYFYLEALLMEQMAHSKTVEEILLLLVRKTNAQFPAGKSYSDYFQERRKQKLGELLRYLADTDPNRASKISRLIEAFERGEI